MVDTRFLGKTLPNKNLISLPQYNQPLLLAAHKATRNSPIAYEYHGLTLYISCLEKDGIVTKLVVSYREAATNKRSKRDMGKLRLKKVYSPMCEHELPMDQPIPADVINATLDSVMPTLFLPKLFDELPQLKTDELSFAILGPFALHRVQELRNCEESTKEKQNSAMKTMLGLWGDQPLRNITPENCAKDLLDKMPFSTAKECVRVLRQMFLAEFANVVMDHKVWERYHLSVKMRSYSAPRVIRSKLLDNPLPAGMIVPVIKTCMQNITDPHLGGRYLGALCILLEAISVDEACALSVASLKELDHNPGAYKLIVDHYIKTYGERKPRDGHVRDHRHTRELILDEHQNRDIGVCDICAAAWLLFKKSHDLDDLSLIMTNPINQDRVLSPAKYDDWLAETFTHQLAQQSVQLGNQEITGKCSASELLAATAIELMRTQGRFSEEEIRYHIGERPLKMDARHYAGFAEEAAILKMGEMLTCACQAIIRNTFCEKTVTRSKKEFSIDGTPGRMTQAFLAIKLPPASSEKDLLIKLSARFGFSAEVITK